MKVYHCKDPIGPGVKVLAPENSCLFCNHCTDIFWDYTHGIYMTYCDNEKDIKIGAKGECKYFEEERKKND